MRDIFDVRDEITLSLVEALKLKLLVREKAAALKRYTDNPEAYELYLQGRYHYQKYSPDGLFKAINLFERAIEIVGLRHHHHALGTSLARPLHVPSPSCVIGSETSHFENWNIGIAGRVRKRPCEQSGR
jgi:hypothetical protein